MPPKVKDSGDDSSSGALNSGLDAEEKLQKSMLEIQSLQKELEIKNEINARLREQLADAKQDKGQLQGIIQSQGIDRIDLTAHMSRQFKTMQSELTSEVNRLENTTSELQTKLSVIQSAYAEAKKSHTSIIQEKDSKIEDLTLKLSYLTAEFENMLSETLGKMTKKLEIVSTRWKENDRVTLSEQNARRLDDFQLTRLALGN